MLSFLIITTISQLRGSLCMDGRCPSSLLSLQSSQSREKSRAHSLVCEVLSALTHGPHGFALIYFNLKGISCGKDGFFLYKPKSSLTYNQCGTNDAFLQYQSIVVSLRMHCGGLGLVPRWRSIAYQREEISSTRKVLPLEDLQRSRLVGDSPIRDSLMLKSTRAFGNSRIEWREYQSLNSVTSQERLRIPVRYENWRCQLRIPDVDEDLAYWRRSHIINWPSCLPLEMAALRFSGMSWTSVVCQANQSLSLQLFAMDQASFLTWDNVYLGSVSLPRWSVTYTQSCLLILL